MTELVRIIVIWYLFTNFVDMNVLVKELNTLVNVLFNYIIDIQLVLLVLIFERSIQYYLDDVCDVFCSEVQVRDLDIVLFDCVGFSLLQRIGIDRFNFVGIGDDKVATISIFLNSGSKVVEVVVILIVVK